MALGIISVIIGVIIVIIGFTTGTDTVNQQIVQYLGFLIGSVFIVGGLVMITIKKNLEEIIGALYSLERKQEKPAVNYSNSNISAPSSGVIGSTWICKKCGTENPAVSSSCKDCGVYR